MKVPLQGAAAGRCCRCQSAVCALELAGCSCQSAVCALGLGCWSRCRVPLQGAGVGMLCALEKKHVSAAHEYLLLSEVFAGVMFFL